MKFTRVRAFALALSLVVISPSLLCGASGVFHYAYPGEWKQGTLQALGGLMRDQKYADLLTWAYYYTEDEPKEAMVSLIFEGAKLQHVPMMYMLVRHHVRRLQKGLMLSPDEFSLMFFYMLLSLVRAQEDYLACVTVGCPHEGAPKVYNLLKWKYCYWLQAYFDKTSVMYTQVLQKVREVLGRTDYDCLPNPAWILHCYFSGLTSVNFGSPSELEQRKFVDAPETVKSARQTKQKVVLEDFAKSSSWKEFFKDVWQTSWSEWLWGVSK
ncbi:hypothetical protein K2X40_00950 [Candidatus Babeliales bacterium]|nr:hypothetical protein [Candidatus Babeliales bacterium]